MLTRACCLLPLSSKGPLRHPASGLERRPGLRQGRGRDGWGLRRRRASPALTVPGRRDGCGGAGGAAGRRGVAGARRGRLRPGRPRAGAPAGECLLRGAGGAAQREERGAGDAGGQARVLREVVPAGRPDGAPRDRRGGPAAGGAGGDGAAVPAAHAVGGGGAGAQLDPLRLPRPAHRWSPQKPAAGGRRVPAGPVVGPGDARTFAPLTGHPALNGPGAAVPRSPPPPPSAACGAAVCFGLPAIPARLCWRRQFLVGAAGNSRGPAPPRGDEPPVPPRAGRQALGGRAAASPEMRGPAQGGRPPPGPARPAAPREGAGAKRRHLLQRGGHDRRQRPTGAGTASIAGSGLHLVGSGGRSSEERDPPKAACLFLPPHPELRFSRLRAVPASRRQSRLLSAAPRLAEEEAVTTDQQSQAGAFYPPPPPEPCWERPDVTQRRVWGAPSPDDAILPTSAEGRKDPAVLTAFGAFAAACSSSRPSLRAA